jgi:aminopeptidase C
MFYDHINKSNVFLENMIELADEKLDSRIVQQLISEPVGGQTICSKEAPCDS